MNSQTVAPKQNSHQQQRNARPNKRKGSDSSMPDEEKMKEEKYDYIGRGGRAVIEMGGRKSLKAVRN